MGVAVDCLSSLSCFVCLYLNQQVLCLLHAGHYLGEGILDISMKTLATRAGWMFGTMVGAVFGLGVYSVSWVGKEIVFQSCVRQFCNPVCLDGIPQLPL